MADETPDNFAAHFAAAMRLRPEHGPAFDLAAEARRRGAVRAVPAGLLRWVKVVQCCSALGLLLIGAIVATGWYRASGSSSVVQSGSTDETQVVFVEATSSTDTTAIGFGGVAVLGLAVVGVTLAAAFGAPSPRFGDLN